MTETPTKKFGVSREERQFGSEKEMVTKYVSPELHKKSNFGYEWVTPYSKELIPNVRNLRHALDHWGYNLLYYTMSTGTYSGNRLFCFIVGNPLEKRHLDSIEQQLKIPLTQFLNLPRYATIML